MAICKCGCGKEIIVKPYCLCKGRKIPEFIWGHNLKGKKFSPNARRKKKYDYSLLGTNIGNCVTCGKNLIFKAHHFRLGSPKYCHGHNPEPKESIENKKIAYKGRILRPSWTVEQRKAFSGSSNPRYGKGWNGNLEQLLTINRCNMNNPEWKACWLTKILKASHRRPNYLEMFLDERIQIIHPGEFKYTGDGEIIIGGKNPDWFNINGKKQVIEFFGRHWHKSEDEANKVNHYEKYGYKCLVIWSEELKNLEILDRKLKEF